MKPDLYGQLRRYGEYVTDQVARVAVEEVLPSAPPTTVVAEAGLPRRRRWRRLLAAAIVVVVLAVAAVTLFGSNDGTEQVQVTGRPGGGLPLAVAAQWGPPAGLAADPDGGVVFVAMASPVSTPVDGVPLSFEGPGGILRVDTQTLDVTALAEVDGATALAVSDGSVWVTGIFTDVVTRLDAESGELLASIELPTPLPGFEEIDEVFLPGHVAAAGDHVWVSTARGFVAQIDIDTNRVVALHELTPVAPGRMVADNSGVWVAELQEGVTRIEATPVQSPGVEVPVVSDSATVPAKLPDPVPPIAVDSLVVHDGVVFATGNYAETNSGYPRRDRATVRIEGQQVIFRGSSVGWANLYTTSLDSMWWGLWGTDPEGRNLTGFDPAEGRNLTGFDMRGTNPPGFVGDVVTGVGAGVTGFVGAAGRLWIVDERALTIFDPETWTEETLRLP